MAFAAFVGIFGIAIAVDLFLSYVLKVMWVWFVTPAFAIAAPSVSMILGMILMIALVKGIKVDKQHDWDVFFKALIMRIVTILVTWGIAWGVHLYV